MPDHPADDDRNDVLLAATKIDRLLAGAGANWHVRVVDSTGSTNADLLADVRGGAGRAELPALLPAVLVARHQTAGRGRLGRTWRSAEHTSLTVSFALMIARRMALLEGVTLVCGLAVRDVIARLGVAAQLKWPNDVLVGGRKLAGILVEAHAIGESTALVIGVGLNLDAVPGAADGIATTNLRDEGLIAPDRNALVAALAMALAERLAAFERAGFAPFADDWRAVDAFAGRAVTVRMADAAPISGVHAGIDRSGALLLDAADGQRRFAGGDISLRLTR